MTHPAISQETILREQRKVLAAIIGELLDVVMTVEPENDEEAEMLALLIQRSKAAIEGVMT